MTPPGSEDRPSAPRTPAGPLAISAEDLGLHGGGAVYEHVTVAVPAGRLLVVRGPAGSGRTSLLLTLAGRMVPDAGRLEVFGHLLPRHAMTVRHLVAVGEITGINGLDDALTVEQHIAERLALHSPWWQWWIRRSAVRAVIEKIDEAIAYAFGAAAGAGDGTGHSAGGRGWFFLCANSGRQAHSLCIA